MNRHALLRPQGEGPALVGGGLALRARTWWRAVDLDRQLAEGSDPSRCPELSLRAAQLTDMRQRVNFASELESVVAAARRRRRSAPTDCVPLRRVEIHEAEGDLLALADALRSSARCRPHAAGIVSFLLRDATSPLYYAGGNATAGQLARVATAGFAGP
jgi:hypothetical protein